MHGMQETSGRVEINGRHRNVQAIDFTDPLNGFNTNLRSGY